MIIPDSSLILYAYDTASPKHIAAKKWWENLLSGDESVGLVHPVVFSFLRVSTKPSAFSRPLSLVQSAELIQTWLDRKIVRLLGESQNHVSDVIDILTAAGATGGNLVVDAQIAAIAKAHEATVHTADRDFQRFRGIACYYPLDDVVSK
ncbi:TA system VapC family ribonuclease toxin [Bythopirellula goksoeyrii]|uniref:TA system VapC family ribonuclease toxin n=1 Tax=Bythopirellula goksoeyrii TaxID=1400387 RepID=UPI0011CD479A